MRYFKLLLFVAAILLWLSCSQTKKQEIKQGKDDIPNQFHRDTVLNTYRFKIVNDIATLDIKKIVVDSKIHFILDLDYRGSEILNKRLSKKDVIDENKTRLFLDTLTNDFTGRAILKDIKFKFTRGSTLYFDAVLLDTILQNKIFGRFNLFYKTDRKGEIYGWITDEVYNLP